MSCLHTIQCMVRDASPESNNLESKIATEISSIELLRIELYWAL